MIDLGITLISVILRRLIAKKKTIQKRFIVSVLLWIISQLLIAGDHLPKTNIIPFRVLVEMCSKCCYSSYE